jgi:excisionase family DNA binding protein
VWLELAKPATMIYMQTLELSKSSTGWIEQIEKWLNEGNKVTVKADLPTVSPSEMAESMGVSRAAVQKWIASGKVSTIKKGTYHRIEISEVERFRRDYHNEMSRSLENEIETELFG